MKLKNNIAIPPYLGFNTTNVSIISGPAAGVYIIMSPSSASYSDDLKADLASLVDRDSAFTSKYFVAVGGLKGIATDMEDATVPTEFVKNLLKGINYQGTEEVPYILKLKGGNISNIGISKHDSEDVLIVTITRDPRNVQIAAKVVSRDDIAGPSGTLAEDAASSAETVRDTFSGAGAKLALPVAITAGIAAIIMSSKRNELSKTLQDDVGVTSGTDIATLQSLSDPNPDDDDVASGVLDITI